MIIRKWAKDFVISTVSVFAILMLIMVCVGFVTWEKPNPDWLKILRLSLAGGFAWSLLSMLDDWKGKTSAPNCPNKPSDH